MSSVYRPSVVIFRRFLAARVTSKSKKEAKASDVPPVPILLKDSSVQLETVLVTPTVKKERKTSKKEKAVVSTSKDASAEVKTEKVAILEKVKLTKQQKIAALAIDETAEILSSFNINEAPSSASPPQSKVEAPAPVAKKAKKEVVKKENDSEPETKKKTKSTSSKEEKAAPPAQVVTQSAEAPAAVKKEKDKTAGLPTPPATPPSSVIERPQNDNYLLNFPLWADHKSPPLANLLAYDRAAELGMKRYPSVGVIMRDSQTPQQIFLLKRWRDKKVAELGSEAEFQFYVQKIKSEGERLHNCLRLFLGENMPEKELPLVDALKPLWASFRPVLDKISAVCAIETAVHHKPLGYAGIADCVCEIDGQLVVIDWKVSERQRVNLAQTYDTPIQIIAYIGALNSLYALNEAQKLSQSATSQKESSQQLYVPPRLIRHGIAVIGYRDGSPAHVHAIDEGACEFYWQKWLEKVYQYWHKKANPQSAFTSSPPTAQLPSPQ